MYYSVFCIGRLPWPKWSIFSLNDVERGIQVLTKLVPPEKIYIRSYCRGPASVVKEAADVFALDGTLSMSKIFFKSSNVILEAPRDWAPVKTSLASSSFFDWKEGANRV